eukprot:TRINITY_DN6156_c0_g1_i4.p1 TRINITY_DN6156_c0_g1~~TRINITY_DN6156_c0_g1_i4.p1  ORF type:complete len:1010 (+),score=265.03 TRINITY_DN6156_c0_g1_i4:32-3031(+)
MEFRKKLIQYSPEEQKFYTQLLARKHREYLQLLLDPGHRGKDFWDVVVITAIDESQQRYYEQQIREKLARREIPNTAKYHVIPDPKGPKVGSGGSTLVVLDFLEKTYGSDLDQFRILLIHAGGYSKRLANHSISGKIFCPVPFFLNKASPCITMLEMKFMMFIDFPKKMNAGVFLTCADDFQFFESEGCDFTRPGVTALAHPSIIEIGLTHGVFVLDKEEIKNFDNNSITPRKCIRFLHKPTLETMKEAGALVENQEYEIFVDSNYYFDRSVEKRLLELHGRITLDCEIDAYGDFLQPLGEHAVDTYFSNTRTTGSINDILMEKRKVLYETLRNVPINVIPFVPSLWVHIGTCREYIEHLCQNLPDFGFQRFTFSHIASKEGFGTDNISAHSCVQYSLLSDSVTVDRDSVIEYCNILNDRPVYIGKQTILSQVSLPKSVDAVVGGVLMHTLVLSQNGNTRFVTVMFGIDDDLKAGGSQVFLRGVSIDELVKHLGLDGEEVFDSKSKSLWTLRLFAVCETAEESAEYSVKLLNVLDALKNGREMASLDWRNVPRISLGSAIELKDMHGQSYHFRTKQEQRITMLKMQSLFQREIDVLTWLNDLPLIQGYVDSLINGNAESENHLHDFLNMCIDELVTEPGVEKARSLFSMSVLLSEISRLFPENNPLFRNLYKTWGDELHKRAYGHQKDSILRHFVPKENEVGMFLKNKTPLREGATASVTLPARIILAGGWSDTPPFCCDQGGDIVNVAININGKMPINATTKVLKEKVIRLRTVDHNVQQDFTFDQLADLFTYTDPGQPISLHKACLCFTLFPRFCLEVHKNVTNEILKSEAAAILGDFGIELTTFVDIPKGSGLGTSSIIMLACVRAVRHLFGIQSSTPEQIREEFNAVLAVEQMLTTGGGWQDQVGGGTPGLKFITANADVYPEYVISPVHFDKEHVDYFNDRLLVVYTGKTRLAAPILWNIVDNYFMRRTFAEGPSTKQILLDIKDNLKFENWPR